MGKNFRPVKFLVSITIMIVAVLLVLTQITEDNEFGFLLDVPPNALVTYIEQDGREVEMTIANFNQESIACWLQVELDIIDKDGKVIATDTSEFLKVNPNIPSLAIFDSDTFGKELTGKGGFNVRPMMTCSVDLKKSLTPKDTFAEDWFSEGLTGNGVAQFQQPLVVNPSELVVRVYSSDKSCGVGVDILDDTCKSKTKSGANLFHDTFNGRMMIGKQTITSSNTVKLGEFKVNDEDIEKFLEDGRYSSRQLITLDGVVKIAFEKVPVFNYLIPLQTQRTFVENFDHPFYKTNNWEIILNQVLTHRDLDIAKNVDRTSLITGDTNEGCPVGQHRENGICVKDTIGGGTPEENPFDNPELLKCKVNEYINSAGQCTPVEVAPTPQECQAQGKVFVLGLGCISQGGGGVQNFKPRSTGDDIFSQLSVCLASGDPTCLTSTTFLPLWIGGIGFIILIVALMQTKPVQPRTTDIYGIPPPY